MRRYLILGSGIAGISAAEAIRVCDPQGEITLVCDERDGFYSRPGLAYLLTGEIPERQIFPYTEKDFARLNLRRMTARVVRLHPPEHEVELETGERLPYDRLLVATGASAVRSEAPGTNLDGVVKLDNLEDARRILALALKVKSAVVVGGGITALEIVEGLVKRGVKTHYLIRGDRYWSNVLDEVESRLIEGRLRHEKVDLHFHTELDEILGQGGKVSGVRARDGKVIPCQMVAIAIGIRPRKELAAAAGLACDRGIVVNEALQTSDPDIFSAGDVAQVYDPVSGTHVLDSLWNPAREQGWAAGHNLAGNPKPYCKPVAFNVTRLAGLTTTIIGAVGRGRDQDLAGIARGDSETWRQLPDAIAAQGGFEVNRLRVLVGKDKLIGAVVMGDQTLSQALQRLVTARADITSIRDRLLAPNAPLGDLLADFWTDWKRSHAG